jgi:mRNA interferase RelE/StbE
MELEFHDSFGKDIGKIKDKSAKSDCLELIGKMKELDSLANLPGLKKLAGFKYFYRIRIGDYRVGIEYRNSKVIFKRFLHRKDVYKYFP